MTITNAAGARYSASLPSTSSIYLPTQESAARATAAQPGAISRRRVLAGLAAGLSAATGAVAITAAAPAAPMSIADFVRECAALGIVYRAHVDPLSISRSFPLGPEREGALDQYSRLLRSAGVLDRSRDDELIGYLLATSTGRQS
jgi:hypothetical protein